MKPYLIFIGFSLFMHIGLSAQNLSHETKKWRIGVSGGGGYLLASTKEAIKAIETSGVDHIKAKDGINDLKCQLQFGGDAHYLINKHWGVGLKYLYSNSNSKIKDVVFNMNGDGITNTVGNIESEYFINYIGPSFFARCFFGENERLALTGVLSAGYSHLRLEQLTVYTPVVGTGHAFGAFTSIGLEYYLLKQLSVGCDLGVFGSTFNKATYDNGVDKYKVDFKDLKENVSNLNFSLSVRVHL